MYNICLFGYGNIGGKLVSIFFKKKYYKNININCIVLKNNNILYKRKINKKCICNIHVYSFLLKRIFYEKKINIIIELIGNLKISTNILYLSLKKKKILITANKNLIAKQYTNIGNYLNNRIFFEASVFGGFPIIENLNNFFKYCPIYKISVVINSTTNYILHNIFFKKKSFLSSLKSAKKNGFSEKKPFFDLMGLDTFYKTFIISKLINKCFYLKKIRVFGIKKINNIIINFFSNNNLEIKLIGNILIKKKLFFIDVSPYVIGKENSFYNLRNEYNMVKIYTKNIGNFTFKGKGAGGKNTCYSIFNNLYNFYKIYKSKYLKNKIYNFNFSKKYIFIFIDNIYINIVDKMIILLKYKKIYLKYLNNNFLVLKTKLNDKRIFYLKNSFKKNFFIFYKILNDLQFNKK